MLFISVYSKMELTEFDVRFCYAPKLGAKLQQIFEIYKNLAWKCKFICVFLRILICAHKNPPISSHFWIETISINILLTEGKEIATWSRSKPCTNYAADIPLIALISELIPLT